MKVIAVAGSGSGSGKTTLVCRILSAMPGLGAVKISPRETVTPVVEWGSGSGGAAKDTARYAAAGAVRVARIVAPRELVPRYWEEAAAGMSGCRGVVVEGSRSLEVGKERFGILVAGGREAGERPERLGGILAKIHLVIINGPTADHGIAFDEILISHKFDSRKVEALDVEHDSGDSWRRLIVRLEDFLN